MRTGRNNAPASEATMTITYAHMTPVASMHTMCRKAAETLRGPPFLLRKLHIIPAELQQRRDSPCDWKTVSLTFYSYSPLAGLTFSSKYRILESVQGRTLPTTEPNASS